LHGLWDTWLIAKANRPYAHSLDLGCGEPDLEGAALKYRRGVKVGRHEGEQKKGADKAKWGMAGRKPKLEQETAAVNEQLSSRTVPKVLAQVRSKRNSDNVINQSPP